MSRSVRPGVVATAFVALALLVGGVGRHWVDTSPKEVAARYVVATAGDAAALDAATGHEGRHTTAEGALAAVYGVPRRAPVVVTDVGSLQREFADIGHVVVRGTADGVPFTTDVSVATGPFSTRVLGEYADPSS